MFLTKQLIIKSNFQGLLFIIFNCSCHDGTVNYKYLRLIISLGRKIAAGIFRLNLILIHGGSMIKESRQFISVKLSAKSFARLENHYIYYFFCSWRGKYLDKRYEKRSASIFLSPTTACKFGKKNSLPKTFCDLNFQLKLLIRSYIHNYTNDLGTQDTKG